MDCPNCQTPLEHATYEDVRVQQCGKCGGYFVARKRLRLIKSSRNQSSEALETEARERQSPDTTERIRCPKCKARKMNKEKIRVEDNKFFMIDVCAHCDNVWFDGGELAQLQLEFEQSAQAIEAFALQKRTQDRTPEQREEFEEQLEKLPVAESFLGAAFTDVLALCGAIGLLIATLISIAYFDRRIVSAAFSLALLACLAWFLLFRMDASRDQRLIGLSVIAVAEVAYLVALIWFI